MSRYSAPQTHLRSPEVSAERYSCVGANLSDVTERRPWTNEGKHDHFAHTFSRLQQTQLRHSRARSPYSVLFVLLVFHTQEHMNVCLCSNSAWSCVWLALCVYILVLRDGELSTRFVRLVRLSALAYNPYFEG